MIFNILPQQHQQSPCLHDFKSVSLPQSILIYSSSLGKCYSSSSKAGRESLLIEVLTNTSYWFGKELRIRITTNFARFEKSIPSCWFRVLLTTLNYLSILVLSSSFMVTNFFNISFLILSYPIFFLKILRTIIGQSLGLINFLMNGTTDCVFNWEVNCIQSFGPDLSLNSCGKVISWTFYKVPDVLHL